MAWVFQLTDGTDTLDLHDNTSFAVEEDGFCELSPARRRGMAGSVCLEAYTAAADGGTNYLCGHGRFDRRPRCCF